MTHNNPSLCTRMTLYLYAMWRWIQTQITQCYCSLETHRIVMIRVFKFWLTALVSTVFHQVISIIFIYFIIIEILPEKELYSHVKDTDFLKSWTLWISSWFYHWNYRKFSFFFLHFALTPGFFSHFGREVKKGFFFWKI